MTPFFDPRVAQWVAARIPPYDRGFGDCQAMGVEHNGCLIAGVVFHNWQPEAGVIEISAASDDRRWLTRPVVSACFGYCFDGLKCQAAVGRHDVNNESARHIWRTFGADEYVIPRLRGRNEAECIAILTEEAWRASRFGKRVRHG